MKELISQYNKVKGKLSTKIKGTPQPFVPNITSNDIRRGYIERRFAQKLNDNLSPITEISESNFGKISKNPLYRTVLLRWRITGTAVEVKTSNRASISEHLGKMPQLRNRLVNLIQFYQS